MGLFDALRGRRYDATMALHRVKSSDSFRIQIPPQVRKTFEQNFVDAINSKYGQRKLTVGEVDREAQKLIDLSGYAQITRISELRPLLEEIANLFHRIHAIMIKILDVLKSDAHEKIMRQNVKVHMINLLRHMKDIEENAQKMKHISPTNYNKIQKEILLYRRVIYAINLWLNTNKVSKDTLISDMKNAFKISIRGRKVA